MCPISDSWKSLSPIEKRAGSFFRAMVAFKDGNIRYFYSFDNSAPRSEAEQGAWMPNAKYGFNGLLRRVVAKFINVSRSIEIYAIRENELVEKYSEGKKVKLTVQVVFFRDDYHIDYDPNHPDNYFQDTTQNT